MKKTNEKYIYITKNGNYRVQIRPSKNIHDKFDGVYTSIKIAINERDTFLAKQKLGLERYVDRNITFSDYCDKYFEWFKNKPKKPSPNTLVQYNGIIKKLKIHFKNKPLYKITTIDIEDFLIKESNRNKIDPNHPNSHNQKPISSNTLHHEYVMLRILFNLAFKKWKIISSNPMENVEEPKIKIVKEIEHIPYEEFEHTLELIENHTNIRDKAIFYLGLCGGLREEEICGIHCQSSNDINSHIDFKNNTIKVKYAIKQNYDTKEYEEYDLKSDYSERILPLPEIAIKSIKEYLNYRNTFVRLLKFNYGNQYKNLPNLFLNKNGDYFRPRYVGKLWRQFARKYDIKATFHGLRHTYITYQMNYNDELSPSEVQALAGHANINTTYKYVHKSSEKMKKATMIFDNIYNDKIDINDNNTISVPIMYIASIINEIDYVDINKIIDLLKYIDPYTEITHTNLSNSLTKVKNYLIEKNPSLAELSNLCQKYSQQDFEKEIKSIYGNKLLIEIMPKEKEYEIC